MALQEVEKRKFGVRGKKKGETRKGKRAESQAGTGEGLLRETRRSSGEGVAVEVNSSISESGEARGIKSENREGHRREVVSATEVARSHRGFGKLQESCDSEESRIMGLNVSSKASKAIYSATKVVSTAGSNQVGVQPNSKRSRHIPTAVRAKVWERDAGACVFVEPGSGRVCGSSFGLEWDHLREFSRGGESSEANLRLLCRQHNNQRRMWEREILEN
ncbi:MAG: HNH endonuclease [Bradymonadales bacterium]|nr:MAG: HNH endonuclease [Bradymonadales bacterium]